MGYLRVDSGGFFSVFVVFVCSSDLVFFPGFGDELRRSKVGMMNGIEEKKEGSVKESASNYHTQCDLP